MADKKVTGFVKLQIPAGAANPAPPVGPALGAQGVNIMQFCQAFHAQTPDLNANNIEAAMEIVAGSARSMGVRIERREMKKKYVPSRKVAAMLQGKAVD